MPKHQGMSNLVSKAMLYESKGKRISKKFMSHDPDARGCIPVLKATSIICEILRIPAPLGPDKQSTEARLQILKHVNFQVIDDPENPGEQVVEYGHFLKAFRQALRTTPLIATNPYVQSDAERDLLKKKVPKKSTMTFDEIAKAIDLNLPKHYRSTTEAYLKMKPPGGRIKLSDFARFMRSINLDLDDEMMARMFKKYDKNHNGSIDAWEFFECFGGAISGHKDDNSTSLFMNKSVPPKQPIEAKKVNLSSEEVCELIKARLPFHFRSSTKAFLAAKGGADPRCHTISFEGLKVFLQNMNIVVPDETIRGLFNHLDDDGSGGIHAKEFIQTFGHAISGEKAENTKNSDHLSYHNTRPDNRVPIVPAKHKWTYEEVKTSLGERLGMIHTSSTIAFMKVKRSNSRFMSFDDLKRILNNLNIDPPDSIIKRIFKDMDTDHDGEIECSEFLEYFGSYINGFAGSFETKPDWYYKELSDLSAHIDKIEGIHVNGPETVEEEEPESAKKSNPTPQKLTKQQELAFTRKFGISPDELNYLNSDANSPVVDGGGPATGVSVNNLELNPSPMAVNNRPQSAGRDRPRSAGAARPQSAGANRSSGGWPQNQPTVNVASSYSQSGTGGPAWGTPSERPRSAGSNRPQSAGPSRPTPKLARNIQTAVNFSTATMGLNDLDDPFSALLKPVSVTNGNTSDQENEPARSPGDISDFSDGALLKELRERKERKEGTFRSKSAQKSRRGEIDPNWETPSSRFGGFNQGPHFKSTVASKLKSAKKIAAMLEKNKVRAKKRAPRSKSRGRGRYDSGRESEPAMYNEMKFRF